MKFKHVIWDWNGTLVDDTWLFVDIMNGVLKDRNLPGITLDDYRNVFDFPVEDYYTKLGFDFSDEAFKTAGLDFIKIYDTFGKNDKDSISIYDLRNLDKILIKKSDD